MDIEETERHLRGLGEQGNFDLRRESGLGTPPGNITLMEPVEEGWAVLDIEEGVIRSRQTFGTEHEACGFVVAIASIKGPARATPIP